MNPKAVVAAAMMMMAVMAVGAASAEPRLGNLGRPVEARTVMQYWQGAWTSPCAVVLKSAADWSAWNHYMVARGMAVSEEVAPAGVDWSQEAVLVVSLGLMPGARMAVSLESADRKGLTTQVTLGLDNAQGGSSPCVVVAMGRAAADAVQLTDAAALGLPGTVQVWTGGPAMVSNDAAGRVAATWGQLKGAYRQ